MDMRKRHFIMGAATLILAAACSVRPAPADYVDPFIGASTSIAEAGVYHGLGKTFPGAATPWGLVQVSPNTITGGDNAPGYSYEHETIEGFAFTQMSGVGWYGDFGNFLVMPTTGPMYTTAGLQDGSVEGWRSHFDKDSETASAGYYSAFLTDYGILAEATAAPHSGMLRFTFPESMESRIQVDLARRVAGCSKRQHVRVVDDSTIEGWMYCPPECGGWGNGDGKADYTVYFYARFSKPFTDFGFWSAEIPEGWARRKDEVVSPEYLSLVSEAPILTGIDELEGDHLGFFTQFPTYEGEAVTLSAGISFVDQDGARRNFESEMEGRSFDRVRSDARELWNDALGRIDVSGGSEEEKVIFYTSLYHALIDPRVFSDVDGRYTGADGRVHDPAEGFTKRTIFSGWDVFRSEMPLLTLIYPKVVSDEINSLVTMAEESGRGYLERWEIVNAYSGCMVGNPALSVIADAYAKGIRTFDVDKAYLFCANTSAMGTDPGLGYCPDGISQTLEYAYDDWCLSRFAQMTGRDADAELYARKAQAYRNIFDPEVSWFRQRLSDGSWAPWPERGRLEESCVECNPYQQGWFVPHDVEGMAELMGGRETALSDLQEFFANTPEDFHWNDYYNHANEPVHWVPYLFNRLGDPARTQKWTRTICANAYRDAVAGLCGNEDCGQMSAWYVFSSMGIHPVCPADNTYEVTSPVFDRVRIRLDGEYHSGRTFTIVAHDNAPGNFYIKKAELDGRELKDMRITFEDINAGSTLELWLGPEAD